MIAFFSGVNELLLLHGIYQVSGVGAPREAYDAAEVQDCHSQLRMCMQRIADVEAINVDLESRLEAQAREYIELESDAAESCGNRAIPGENCFIAVFTTALRVPGLYTGKRSMVH